MKKFFAVMAAAIALLCLGSLAQANITIDTVAVGNAGNAGELSGLGAGGSGPDRVCGAVAYNYNIGKYEVTAAQYTDFLNNKAKSNSDPYGLYSTNMTTTYGCNIQRSGGGTPANPYVYTVASDWANRPVNCVSYWDSLRFTNWLGNGQGTGDTETGAYTLNGYNGTNGGTIQRNAGWTWALTSEDEWYKAAYYKGGGTNAGYWLYPTQSDSTPGRDMADASGNNANYHRDHYLIGSPYYRTEVGEFQNSDSAYGTFDQGGNVWEWNEAIANQNDSSVFRNMRGDSWGSNDYTLRSSARNSFNLPGYEGGTVGFRVSQTPGAAVPEPMSVILAAGGLLSILGIRRRKA